MAFLGGLALLGSTAEAGAELSEKRARAAEMQQQAQDAKDAQQGSLAIGNVMAGVAGVPGIGGLAGVGQQPQGGAPAAPGAQPAPQQPPSQQPAGGAPSPAGGQPGAPVSFNYPGAQGGQQNPMLVALQTLARGLGIGAGGGQQPGYTGTAATGTQPAAPGQYSPRQVAQAQPPEPGQPQPPQPSLTQQPQGQQPPQQPQQPGDAATRPWQPGQPIKTTADLAGAIRAYNPGISPRAFTHAMSIGMKLLGQEAQAEYMRQRPELQREAISERERAAEMAHPGAGAFQDWLIAHPHASPEEVGSALTQFTGKAQILAQRGAQAQELEEKKQTGRIEAIGARGEQAQKLQQQKADAALKLEGVKEMDRENLLALGAKNKQDLEKEKQDYATANHPFGNSAEGMSMYLFYKAHPHATPEDYWAAKAKYRPQTAGQVRAEQQQQAAQATLQDIGNAIDNLIQNPQVPLTGMGGALERYAEWFRGVTGIGDQATPGQEFEQNIRVIQEMWPQSVARRTITNAQERSRLDTIIRGLGTFTSRQAALNSLRQAQEILKRHAGIKGTPATDEDEDEKPSGGDTAEPVPTREERKLKPLDDAMKNTIIRLNQQGWEASEIRAYVRKHGYDPDSD